MQHLLDSAKKESLGTWIEVRKDALLENLQTIRNLQPRETQIMAVVKANAYGHGLKIVASHLEGRVAYLAVSSLREIQELREQKIETPVLLLSRLMPAEVENAVATGASLSISSFEEARALSEAALAQGKRTVIHIKVDTGMGRLGIPLESALANIERIAELEGLVFEGIFTHFPSAETEDGFTQRQVRDFALLLSALETKGIVFSLRHGANSAGSMRVQSPVFNMFRPGLMMYGIYPDASLQKMVSLVPALSLKSRVISLKRLMPGQSSGYGREFTTEKPVTLAILPIGYSHGYPWRCSSKAFALWKGHVIPVAGRVSMDYLTLNFGDLRPSPGDEVTLIGEDQGNRISSEDVAGWAGTIPYEIVTGLALNIPRLYV